MAIRYSKRISEKKNFILGITCFFFLAAMFLSMGCIELKAAEESETQNPGVDKVELELQPAFIVGTPVWQASGNDEWVFNYHYMRPELTNMSNVMEYATMTLKAYPSDEILATNWGDWTVQTEWTVSGDTDIIRLANEDTSSGWEGVPGTGRPEGTGSTVGYFNGEQWVGPYYEETAIIIPTGKTGACIVSVNVLDKTGKVIFTLPGKKITVKRCLDANPDIRVIETATNKAVYGCIVKDDGGLSSVDFSGSLYANYYYTGNPIIPAVMLTDKGSTLKEGTDYTVSYENNVNVGYWISGCPGAAIVITGCGDYSGTIRIHFVIYPNLNNQENNQGTTENKPTLSCTKTYKKALDSKPFKLSVKNAKGTVSYTSSNKKVATVNSKGIVTLKGTGLAKITVKASNGSVVSKVYVAPKKTSISKAKSTAKKTVTVTWKKDTKATGYEIQCNTNKNFKSGNKTVTVKKAKTTSAKVTKLKSGKKYYVRMRSYKTINGKKYAGSWSKVLAVKVK